MGGAFAAPCVHPADGAMATREEIWRPVPLPNGQKIRGKGAHSNGDDRRGRHATEGTGRTGIQKEGTLRAQRASRLTQARMTFPLRSQKSLTGLPELAMPGGNIYFFFFFVSALFSPPIIRENVLRRGRAFCDGDIFFFFFLPVRARICAQGGFQVCTSCTVDTVCTSCTDIRMRGKRWGTFEAEGSIVAHRQ